MATIFIKARPKVNARIDVIQFTRINGQFVSLEIGGKWDAETFTLTVPTLTGPIVVTDEGFWVCRNSLNQLFVLSDEQFTKDYDLA